MVRVRTNVSAPTQRQEAEPVKKDMHIPTPEEISAQLKEHFGDKRSNKEIQELASELHQAFEEMMRSPIDKNSIFAQYMPQPPHLTIKAYTSECFMIDREAYPRDYSSLKQYMFKTYQITVAYSTNWISLAYVDPDAPF